MVTDIPVFLNRQAAGEQLATAIATAYQAEIATSPGTQPIVYALPKGGLPLAAVVAKRLQCPLDVLVAKKVSLPQQPELAIAAVAASGQVVYPSAATPTDQAGWQAALTYAYSQAQQQAQLFHHEGLPPSATDRIAIVVDDGMATGLTMLAAVHALRTAQPREVWVAAPVAPPETCATLAAHCDRLIVLAQPQPFMSVSRFYQHFPQVSLEEALDCWRDRP